jgi:hypothetical protein
MNRSKFSLADVLTVLTALAFGFVCFLGANFLNIRDEIVWNMPRTTGCIVIAVFIVTLLFITAFGAKLLKRTSRNFKTCFVWEVILLVFFVLFAVFFATKTSPFPHYFTVTEQKSEINRKLQEGIAQAENMFAAYENYARDRKYLYKSKLHSVTAAKNIDPWEYAAYGFKNNNIADSIQIETKIFALEADLFPTNYYETKEVATAWLKDAKNITSSWKPIGIVGIVNDIEDNSKKWLKELINLSQVHEDGEQITDFEYTLSFSYVKTHFAKFGNPTWLTIGLTLLAYMLMLLSWFVTKRSTKFPGWKFLFGSGKSSNNEL